jgi:hypothetical protein
MNIKRSQNFFWKKFFFTKWSTWLILLLHLVIVGFLLFKIEKDGWFLGKQWIEREEKIGPVKKAFGGYFNPKISSVNGFFACVFPNLIFLPIIIWTFFFSPLSWLFWKQFDEVGQKTQTDGTDALFILFETPISRKKIFRRKMTFLTTFFSVLYLTLFSLPLSLLLWKTGYFSNFTWWQIFLFQVFNFLIIPLLLFVPLVVLSFSLASLNSVWYIIFKWFGRLSLIFISLLSVSGGALQWGKDFFNWLRQNWLLTTLTIVGMVIYLALFALSLAYREYQKKDLE